MYDAIVLAGGRARRLGGAPKPQLTVGGRRLLDHVLDAVHDAGRLVVVGPEQTVEPAVERPVTWCREDPPGGGPVAAVAAGLPWTSADVVVLLAADLPWIAPAVPALRAALPRAGVAVLTDAGGRMNYLAAAWRRSALTGALARTGAGPGGSMRSLLARVPVVEVPDVHGWGRDCDTWDDLARARAEGGRGDA